MATQVPEGTAWAREGKAFARDVEALSGGQVRIKWYLGGIAGDELKVGDRIRRDQLDGVGSGGVLCTQLAPTMRVTRLVGLFRTREESAYVLGRLKPTLDVEFTKSGYANLWEAGLGPEIAFTRTPVHTFEELQSQRLWIWDIDEVFGAGLAELGLKTVPMPLEAAGRAFEEGRTDGFLTLPTAALAFQWSAQVHYGTALQIGFLSACLLVSNRAFDQLPVEAQKIVRGAAAKFQVRMEDIGREQDQALLNGLFKRQGLTLVPVSEPFRAAFFERARVLRAKQADKVVPAALLKRVDDLLDEYRRAHP